MQLVHCCSLAAGAVTLEYESFEFTDDLLTGPNCVYTAGSNTRQLQTDTSPSSIWRGKKKKIMRKQRSNVMTLNFSLELFE